MMMLTRLRLMVNACVIIGAMTLMVWPKRIHGRQSSMYFKAVGCNGDSGLTQMLHMSPQLQLTTSISARSSLQCLTRMAERYDVSTRGASSLTLMVLSFRKVSDASSLVCVRLEPKKTVQVVPADADSTGESDDRNAVTKDMAPETCIFNFLSASSCEVFSSVGPKTVVLLTPWPERQGILASCDLDTDGGGWTVIQRRQDGNVDFFKDWQSYKIGFGDVSGEFWFGLENIRHLVTSRVSYEIRFDMTTKEGEKRHALYDYFHVAAEDDYYRLSVGNYSGGDAGDSFSRHNDAPFSTHDKGASGNGQKCAVHFFCGFWFADIDTDKCLTVNPNGAYGDNYWAGLDGGPSYSLIFIEMKIRPSTD